MWNEIEDKLHEIETAPDEIEFLSRRDLLQSLEKWSVVVIDRIAREAQLSSSDAGEDSLKRHGGWVEVRCGSWLNRGGSWVNGGGSWVNRSGGGWSNSRGGGGWINRRGS